MQIAKCKFSICILQFAFCISLLFCIAHPKSVLIKEIRPKMIVPYRSACVCMECSLSGGLRVSPNGAIAKFGAPHKEETSHSGEGMPIDRGFPKRGTPAHLTFA
jgi:hypothetical protein